jgi:dienelactone hydrolase
MTSFSGRPRQQPGGQTPSRKVDEREVQIAAGGVTLLGHLAIPAGATGVVVFAHGSGSGRHSSRNRFVAEVLQEGGLATLLMDLLTVAEEQVDLKTRHLRFDIPLLAERLRDTAAWLLENTATRDLRVGYFGASTGGGAALVAAALRPQAVGAVVSRGGRPDLAGPALARVLAPTLLIVGENDPVVVDLNQAAYAELQCEKQLAIVPGATHLFEEPGTLAEVADLARNWFKRHIGVARD